MPRASQPSGGATAERRQLTVMFSDVVGSTALAESLDPEEVREVMHAYQAKCREVIEEFGGHVAQYLGDGVVAYFGYPQASEDAPSNAVRAGLGIAPAMRALTLESGHLQEPLQVRIGIHTGIVVVGGSRGSGEDGDHLAFGGTPNIAARVEALATAGTVVLTAATHRLVAEYFRFRELGPHELKGIADPVQLYQVLDATDVETRFDVSVRAGLIPLVGRVDDLDLLEQQWRKAKARDGQIVLLSGDAGIGKTRLLRELRGRIEAEDHATIDCRCSPHHQNSALYPLLRYIQQLLGFQASDSAAKRLTKLDEALDPYTGRSPDTLALFASLLSLPHPDGIPPLALTPQTQKHRTLEALVNWLLDTAERQPVHIELEDLHWADASTLELLDLLIVRAIDAPIYLVMTSRDKSVLVRWETQPHVSHVELDRLPPADIEQLISAVSNARPLDENVVRQISAKTDGVPLFVEELTKMVLESAEGAENYGAELSIPATLRDPLMARLDQLPSALGVAQLGAALGREFSHALLRAISPLDETTLQDGLDSLVETELLEREDLAEGTYYSFKHALIQDAAYGSLLKSRRQQFHRLASEVLEQGFAQIAVTQPEIVAHHFEAAGLGERAVPHLQRAGQRALGQSAFVEAVHHFSKALELISEGEASPASDQIELAFRSSLGVALVATEGYGSPSVERNYSRAEELCGSLGDEPELFASVYGLWTYHMIRGHRDSTFELAERLEQLADGPESAYIATSARGVTHYWSGDFPRAEAILQEAIDRYDPSFHELLDPMLGDDAALLAHLYQAWTLVELGLFDQAQRGLETLPKPGGSEPSPYLRVTALVFEMIGLLNMAEYEKALAMAEQVIALATELQFPFFLGSGTSVHGSALTHTGSVEQGIAELEQGAAIYQATGDEASRGYWLARIAEGFLAAGNSSDGLAAVDEAIESRATNLGRFNVIELQRIRGELLLLKPEDVVAAEACFRQALQLAEMQGAPRLGLMAAESYARMLASQGRRGDAVEVLRAHLDRMPEASARPVTENARRLLEELS